MADSLILPHEYHSIRNTGRNAVADQPVRAESIIVCGIYEPLAGAPGHYQRHERQSLDPID